MFHLRSTNSMTSSSKFKNLDRLYFTVCFIMGVFAIVRQVFSELVSTGVVIPKEEVAPPTVPMDYNWARVRKVHCITLCCSMCL